jgi:hypothetical protein
VLVSLRLITCWVLERGIRAAVTADGAMAVLVAVVSPGTGENEFGEEGLTLMLVATLTN